jgi:hypothetical protein
MTDSLKEVYEEERPTPLFTLADKWGMRRDQNEERRRKSAEGSKRREREEDGVSIQVTSPPLALVLIFSDTLEISLAGLMYQV